MYESRASTWDKKVVQPAELFVAQGHGWALFRIMVRNAPKCREGVRTVVEGRENHNCSGFSECGGWWFVLNGRLRSSQVGNQTRAEASSRPWLVATASVSEYVRLPQYLVHSPLVLI